jgi:hypothetical protein
VIQTLQLVAMARHNLAHGKAGTRELAPWLEHLLALDDAALANAFPGETA